MSLIQSSSISESSIETIGRAHNTGNGLSCVGAPFNATQCRHRCDGQRNLQFYLNFTARNMALSIDLSPLTRNQTHAECSSPIVGCLIYCNNDNYSICILINLPPFVSIGFPMTKRGA